VFDQASGFLSKTQIWEDRCNRSDDMDFRSDALIHKASIAIQIQTSGRQSSWFGRAKPLYGNYLQRTFNRPDNRETPSGCGSQTGKIFSEILRISVAQLSIRMAYDHRLDGAQFYQARRLFELSAYK